jgi:hypothetical protein
VTLKLNDFWSGAMYADRGDRVAVVDDEHAGRCLRVVRVDLMGRQQLLLDRHIEARRKELLRDERDRVRLRQRALVDQLDGRA